MREYRILPEAEMQRQNDFRDKVKNISDGKREALGRSLMA